MNFSGQPGHRAGRRPVGLLRGGRGRGVHGHRGRPGRADGRRQRRLPRLLGQPPPLGPLPARTALLPQPGAAGRARHRRPAIPRQGALSRAVKTQDAGRVDVYLHAEFSHIRVRP